MRYGSEFPFSFPACLVLCFNQFKFTYVIHRPYVVGQYSLCVLLETGVKLLISWRVSSSGIWRRVVRWVEPDVSEEHIASVFRVEEEFSKPASCLATACSLVCWTILRPWRWRRYVPPKRRMQLNVLHGVISQKMILFITTAVKTSSFWYLDFCRYTIERFSIVCNLVCNSLYYCWLEYD
jgi:hypothetical protein